VELAEGIITQHMRDKEAHNTYKKKNSIIHIALIISIENGIMHEIRKYELASEI